MAIKLPKYRIPWNAGTSAIVLPLQEKTEFLCPKGRDYNIFPQVSGDLDVIGQPLYEYFFGTQQFSLTYPFFWNYGLWAWHQSGGTLSGFQGKGNDEPFSSYLKTNLFAREPDLNYCKKGNLIKESKSVILSNIIPFKASTIYSLNPIFYKDKFIADTVFIDGLETYVPNSYTGNNFYTIIYNPLEFNKYHFGEAIYLVYLNGIKDNGPTDSHVPFMLAVNQFKLFLSKHKRTRLVIFLEKEKNYAEEYTFWTFKTQKEFNDNVKAAYSQYPIYEVNGPDVVPVPLIISEIEDFYGS